MKCIICEKETKATYRDFPLCDKCQSEIPSYKVHFAIHDMNKEKIGNMRCCQNCKHNHTCAKTCDIIWCKGWESDDLKKEDRYLYE